MNDRRAPQADAPPDLWTVVERHGRAMAAGDQEQVLADFRPDRVAQLVASVALPEELVSAEVLGLDPEPDGVVAAHIRYTAAGGEQVVLRSRWIRLGAGWRVTQVRNVPETPPRLPFEAPSADGIDAPHWAGLRHCELRIQRCAGCGTWIWSPRPMCPGCHGTDLGWPAVEPAGVLYSWTRTWQPFAPGLRGHLPYVVVLVELPHAGGRRVLGVLLAGDGATPRIGGPVEGAFERSSDGGWPLLRWGLS